MHDEPVFDLDEFLDLEVPSELAEEVRRIATTQPLPPLYIQFIGSTPAFSVVKIFLEVEPGVLTECSVEVAALLGWQLRHYGWTCGVCVHEPEDGVLSVVRRQVYWEMLGVDQPSARQTRRRRRKRDRWRR